MASTGKPCRVCGRTVVAGAARGGVKATICPACAGSSCDSALETTEVKQPKRTPAAAPPIHKEPRERSPALPAVIGRFRILEQLGAGAFGTVYRALDPVLNREVALKIPHSGALQSERMRSRFLREPKAAAQLRHPHIVPVFDAGEFPGGFYLATAYIAGDTLQEFLNKQWCEYRMAATLTAQLADALHYAHESGIVHRDVKPANIMLDQHRQPLLMDFGLARIKSEDEKLTRDGAIVGTPAYMAPEQIDSSLGEVGPASDQYSLGVVLYELLCGSTPFRGPTSKVLADVLRTEPQRPRARDRSVPRDLETVCLKAMSKKPTARYESCQALAEDLRRWLAGEPIRARRISAAERTLRWARRNPTTVTLLSLVAGLILVALAITTWALRDQRNKLHELMAKEHAVRAANDNLRIAIEAERRAASKLAAANEQLKEAAAIARQQQQETEAALNAARVSEAKASQAQKDALAEKQRADEERKKSEELAVETVRQAEAYRRAHYRSQMQLASQAIYQSNWARLEALLRESKPLEAQSDLRHFEWYYLAEFASGAVRQTSQRRDIWSTTFLTTPGRTGIKKLQLSDDGDSLAGVMTDGSIVVWSLITKSPIFTMPAPKNANEKPDSTFAYRIQNLRSLTSGPSFSHDFHYVLDRTDVAGERKLMHVISGRQVPSPLSGNRLLGITRQKELLAEYFKDVPVTLLEYTRHYYLQIQSLDSDRSSQINIHTADGKKFGPAPRPHLGDAVQLSPNGKHLLIVAGPHKPAPLHEEFWVLDLEKETVLSNSPLPRVTKYHQIEFAPNNTYFAILATIPTDNTPRLFVYRVDDGLPLFDEPLKCLPHSTAFRFTPDSLDVAVWSPELESVPQHDIDPSLRETPVALYSLEDPSRPPIYLKSYGRSVRDVAFTTDGARVATAGDRLRIWDRSTGNELIQLVRPFAKANSLVFAPDDESLFVADLKGHVYLHNASRKVDSLILTGREVLPQFRVYESWGLHVETVPSTEYAVVLATHEDQPARIAGLQRDDQILAVDGTPVTSLAQLDDALDGKVKVHVLVQRGEARIGPLLMISAARRGPAE